MPDMAATGTNTAISDSAVAITGPLTSFMVSTVASRRGMPRSIFSETPSTTTMASSTTMPMASTRPNSDRAFNEKPNRCITAKVPISDTGTAASGMIEARQVCRNRITTSTTSTMASSRVWTTASMEPRTKMVGS
ncbi:hypothetical protein D9M73_208800 [compost metagenome]